MVIIIHLDSSGNSIQLVGTSMLIGKLYIICTSLQTDNINKNFYYVEIGIPNNNINNLTSTSIIPIHIGRTSHGYIFSEIVSDISRKINYRILDNSTLLETSDSVQISITCEVRD